MGVCTHMLRFMFLQLKMLIYHGVTLGQLLLHHSSASGRASRVKQFWPWAGNEDFGNHLLHVLTFAYTKIFEERAAPKARNAGGSDAGSPALSPSSSSFFGGINLGA